MALFRSRDWRSHFGNSIDEDLQRKSTPVQEGLNRLGFRDWCVKAAGLSCGDDPLREFALVQDAVSQTGGGLRTVLDLFVLDRAVPEHAIRSSLGDRGVSWLCSHGVLRCVGDEKVQSNFCLLCCFGRYLFIDWPIRTPIGRFVSVDTYLSGSSYDCALTVFDRQPRGRLLEIGSGSGLVALLLAERSRHVTAVDIDPVAIKLTKLNLSVNGLRADIVQSDLTDSFSTGARFDFVVVNPPWRIVPPGIAYPNPTARVGTGVDGLDYVRRVLATLPEILAQGGEAAIRFDVPHDGTGTSSFHHECQSLIGCELKMDLAVIDEVPVERQAEISADTCWHLNEDVFDLKERFIDHYSSIGVSSLSEVKCVVTRGGRRSLVRVSSGYCQRGVSA